MRQKSKHALARGEALFTDDIQESAGTLYAAVYCSPIARGRIVSIDCSQVVQQLGVVAFYTAADIDGINDIGYFGEPQPLLAATEVFYVGQPIVLIVADSKSRALAACKAVKCKFEKLSPVFDAREAYEKEIYAQAPRVISMGDANQALRKCDFVVSGTTESGPQEHFYLETQVAYAMPKENEALKLYSATQDPTRVQEVVSRILNIPMNLVEVEVMRLGGGFGGKEENATIWAVLAALAAIKLKRPVKLKLSRSEDMRLSGKRYPVQADFTIGLSKTGKILVYKSMMYLNAGAYTGISLSALERALLHSTGMYYIPNVKVSGVSCLTNLPPFTACRGFGCPEAMFVIESAIFKAAQAMGLSSWEIQKQNLILDGHKFPYGEKVRESQAERCRDLLEKKYHLSKKYIQFNKFNHSHGFVKKGIAVMPVCFGVSFPTLHLNQAGSTIHIYRDGSVVVHTGAVEMGQGIYSKIQSLVARCFSISLDMVTVKQTNTSVIVNGSPDAASVSYELHGTAALEACRELMETLKKVALDMLDKSSLGLDQVSIKHSQVLFNDKVTSLSWKEVVERAYYNRVKLSCHSHYSMPGLWYDYRKEKGNPFLYYVYGMAMVTTTLDCIRGVIQINDVNIVHDNGDSQNLLIDRGQIVGGFLQGAGWSTMEHVAYSPEGVLLTSNTMTYKIPSIYDVPQNMNITFLPNNKKRKSSKQLSLQQLVDQLKNSLISPSSRSGKFSIDGKAIGEPPFIYGVGVYFSILSALKDFLDFNDGVVLPLTPERVMKVLYRFNVGSS